MTLEEYMLLIGIEIFSVQSYFTQDSSVVRNKTGLDGYLGSNWCPNKLDEPLFSKMYFEAVEKNQEVSNYKKRIDETFF